ncbi:MAG: hypothetical protein RIQ89_2367 [Bacteroidota bacterium]|jgi:thiol-disulfide isomerase/thioredoxin
MKGLLFIYCTAILAVIVTGCDPSKKQAATIMGKFSNAANSTIYLQKITEQGEVTLDSVIADGEGKFNLANKASGIDYYLIRSGNKQIAYLILEGNENIEITGDADNLGATYQVVGSEETSLMLGLKRFNMQLSDSLSTVYSEARSANPSKADSVSKVLNNYYQQTMGGYALKMLREHPASFASLSATNRQFINQEKELPLLKQLANNLKAKYPDNKYVKEFEVLIAHLSTLPEGSMAPEIKLLDPAGKMRALSDYKGKLVIIDFWASWCGPCRAEMPSMVQLYKDYRAKGVEIFGVSLDENLSSWNDAIVKDGISWPQVSELKKWDSEVVKAYNVEAIPYTVLIDADGKILAKGLNAEMLRIEIKKRLPNS